MCRNSTPLRMCYALFRSHSFIFGLEFQKEENLEKMMNASSVVEAVFRCCLGNLTMSMRHDDSGVVTEGCLSGGAGNPIGNMGGETKGA